MHTKSDTCFNNDNFIDEYDLSSSQKSLYFINSLNGKAKSAYNEPLIFSINGYVSFGALNGALQHLINKHAILRTSFRVDTLGNIRQRVNEDVDFSLTHKKLSKQDGLQEYINDLIMKPFDFDSAPLLRAVLIQLSQVEYVLVMVQHHIITDGMSSLILVKELSEYYNRLLRNEPAVQAVDVNSYFDIINIQNKNCKLPEYQNKLTYFADMLKGYSGLNLLATPINNEEVDLFSGDRVNFKLDNATAQTLKLFAKQYNITLFHALFAAYIIFISKYARSSDVVVGVPFANRGNDLERKVVGYLINTLPIRAHIQPEKNFVNLVADVKAIILECLGKQDVSFEHIDAKMKEIYGQGTQPSLIQLLFSWSPNVSSLQLTLEGASCKTENAYFSKTAKFDISLYMFEAQSGEVGGYFEYKDNLFEKELMQSLANSFTILVKNLANKPLEKLLSINLIDEEQKGWMKNTLFTTKYDRVVDQSLASLFTETAIAFSQKTGMVFGNRKYSYKTLEQKSNQWAAYIQYKYQQLHNKPIPADALIGLYVDRGEDMIIGMLGILKAGAAYVPIDPQYPQDRIDYIISDSKISLLLTHQDLSSIESIFNSEQIIYMDDTNIQPALSKVDSINNRVARPQDLAYVLYTSGSTGKPKGVGVTHENVICLFEGLNKVFKLSSEDVWSLFHTFCFDISVWEIWGAFLFGGTLVVIPYEVTRNPKEFYQLVANEKVTVLTQTASAFQVFIQEDSNYKERLTHLRYVAFVGESLKLSLLRPWVKKYGVDAPKLANMYGITETTVYTNYKFIMQRDIDLGRDNIGWPLEDFSMCVLNENLDWCPIGFVGEIYIGGRGLSRGYLNRADLTKEKFIPDPHANFLGLPATSLLYRTGDLGRWLPDGSIEYLGRKDFQIKLRGFRIELGEVELALESYPDVSSAVVLLKGEGENAYLAAYYTVKPQAQLDKERLMAHIQSFLPVYMLPSSLTEQNSFPMTVNGKVDRKILQAIDDKQSAKVSNAPLETDTQRVLGKIWAEILGINIKFIGATSNFFELGGNSLLVIKMLTQVNQQLSCDVSVSQFMSVPTLSALAKQVESIDSNKYVTDILLDKLKQDIVLDPAIQPIETANPHIYSPRNILLTGATGFLGAHILYELLVNTPATIYCLIRADSMEQAAEKIASKLAKYGLDSNINYQRICPVLGDLEKDALGLSSEQLNLLVNEIDSIYHVGARVHHIFDYETLYNANVKSTRELIEFATLVRNKSLHFISTLGTQYLDSLDDLSINTNNLAPAEINFNGYLRGKWVSEYLLRAAASRGIAAYIYRPGNIIAGKNAIYEPNDNHTLLRLKGFLQLKKAYANNYELVEMMPVDLLAAAIVNISRQPQKLAYNLNNMQQITWVDYLNLVKLCGFEVNFIGDKNEWNAILNSLEEHNALYKLAFLYKQTDSNIAIAPWKQIQPDYKINTPSYKQMVEEQIRSLVKSRFLEMPAQQKAKHCTDFEYEH